MKTVKIILLLAAVLIRFLTTPAYSQGLPLFLHSGGVDPTTEGFTLLRLGNPTLNPVIGDLGLNAWSIHQGSLSDIAQYSQTLTTQEQGDAANGWIFSLTVRALPPFRQPSFGTFGSFSDGAKTYSLLLGAQPSGDPLVQFGNVQYSLTGGGSGYHNYQLRYQPVIGSASLWIDGTEKLTGLTGASTSSGVKFLWGGGQNPYGTLAANWNEASFTIIPEPSTLALLGLGGWFLAASLIRRRRLTL